MSHVIVCVSLGGVYTGIYKCTLLGVSLQGARGTLGLSQTTGQCICKTKRLMLVTLSNWTKICNIFFHDGLPHSLIRFKFIKFYTGLKCYSIWRRHIHATHNARMYCLQLTGCLNKNGDACYWTSCPISHTIQKWITFNYFSVWNKKHLHNPGSCDDVFTADGEFTSSIISRIFLATDKKIPDKK